MDVRYDEHLPGYWVKARFPTLEEAREVAKGIIRSPGTESVQVLTMQKNEEPGGRTYWTLGDIESWAPRLPIDTAETRKVSAGQVVSGKYFIGDEFVCFCMSAEERKRWKEEFPEPPEWLDSPPWDDGPR